MIKEAKGISILILILIILLSMIIGALISYMWVIASYYVEPENTVDLVITEANFPINHAEYFNMTVMNPTHSAAGTNITRICLTAEGDTTIYDVADTYPEKLPILLERGTAKTVKCFMNWGKFAGKNVTVHVYAMDGSGAVFSAKTEFVRLFIETYFNATESCKHFNVSVRNDAQSAINLTLASVYLDYEQINNVSIQLPKRILKEETVDFTCFADWQGHVNPFVEVKTSEGYVIQKRSEVLSLVNLQIPNVTFNENDPNEISISLFNSPDSATLVDVTSIVLTYDGGAGQPTQHPIQLLAPPYRVARNETVAINAIWDWRNYRGINVTITAHTKQGFTSVPTTVTTPPSIVLRITELEFNLTNTNFFLVTVRNMPCSLQNVTIRNATITYETTTIDINETAPTFPQNIIIGDPQPINCTFPWLDYKGKNITVNIHTAEGYNASHKITLPIVTLNVTFDSNMSTQYFSINVQNNALSTITIPGINVNGTSINTTLTYPSLPLTIEDGKTMMIFCPFDWQLLSDTEITIIVTTSNGFGVTTKVKVP